MQLPPLGLYIHLPWCERKCPYCDFNSHERDVLPEAAYIEALTRDMRSEMQDEQRPISSVFIGGGTPSLFSVEAIGELLDLVRSEAALAPDIEITMEANPGSVENSRLAGYAAAGVSRFSLGVQSFDDHCLHSLGRVHDSKAAVAAIDAARGSGARSFNIDLMHGLPGQSLETGLTDIRTALAMGPAHVSWYQLTIEPNTHFYRHPPSLPGENILGTLEEEGALLLCAAGYRRYEVSAWALRGQECQHNLNYWRFGDYLAIGAGAHGKQSTPDGRILRYSKTRAPDDYLASGGISRRGLRELDESDRCGEFMLNALRLDEGFSYELFEGRTGVPASRIADTVSMLSDRGLLQSDADRVKCSDLGWRFLDDVVAAFFTAA